MVSIEKLLPCFLLFCFSLVSASGGDAQGHHVITYRSLQPNKFCSDSRGKPNGRSVPLVHRHGPCSPLTGGEKLSLSEILRLDKLRVPYLQQRAAKGPETEGIQDSEVSIPTKKGSVIGSGNYVATFGYGTPPQQQTVIIDTGSGLSWVQCQPCPSPQCYPQVEAIYDPSKSSTHRDVSCSSPPCRYKISYLDGTFSEGIYASDALTLPGAGRLTQFLFGCGRHNEGFSGAAGLTGLSRSSVSLASQLSNSLGSVFAYCLPSTSSASGFLSFGERSSNAAYTAMLTDSSVPSLYGIDLIGISVALEPLDISPSVFKSPTPIIDSGTVITRLPPSAYDALKTAFSKHMTAYPTATPAEDLFDTCYDFSGSSTITIPKVALQFGGGVTMDLVAQGIIIPTTSTQGCLAFAALQGTTLLGNVQQRTFEVVHDIGMKKIGFRPGACS